METSLRNQWSRIQARITESIRPAGLRAALRSPWFVGATMVAVGLGVGYVLGRRGAGPADVAHEPQAVPPTEDDTQDTALARPSGAMNTVLERVLEIGIDALSDRLQDAVRASDDRSTTPE